MKLILVILAIMSSLISHAAIISFDVNDWKGTAKAIIVDDFANTDTDIKFWWSAGRLYAENWDGLDNTSLSKANVSSICDLKDASLSDTWRMSSNIVLNEIYVFRNIWTGKYVAFQPSKMTATSSEEKLSGTWYVETEGTGDFSYAPGCIKP
jgi:hypothetical protein